MDLGSQKKTDGLNGFFPILSLNTCLYPGPTIPSPKVKKLKPKGNTRRTELDIRSKKNMSLVMPVHGEAPFLSDAIESVFKAQEVNIDFIIILDRCANKEFRETLNFCPKNVTVTVVTSDIPGIVPALNLGIERARNDFVARLDSDDLAIPERFSTQIEFMNMNKDVVCVGSQMTLIDENGNEYGHTNYPTKHFDIMKRMKYQNCIGHPSVMFQKKAVQTVGNYRQILTGSEDYDLWLRLGEVGELANLPQKYTKYRKSKFQITNHLNSTQPITEHSSRIFAAMRNLNIPENLPKEQDSLTALNFRNISKVKTLNSKIARELISAEFLSTAYRERTKKNSRIFSLRKILKSLLLAGWFSPKLLLSFINGHYRFRSVKFEKKNEDLK